MVPQAFVPQSGSYLMSMKGMVDIHDRRPVVLAPDLAMEWLDPSTPKERAELMLMHQGEPSEAFEWFKVVRAAGNTKNQGAHLINPIGEIMAEHS